MKFRTLAVAASMAVAAGAHAATVFSDNFDADAQGLNASVSGWTVSGGTVDVVPVGGSFHFLPAANGNYIDLDGSTGAAGTLSKTLTGLAVGAYSLTFELAGNFRNGGTEATTVSFGGNSTVFTPSSETSTEYFTITGYSTDGTLTLSFKDDSHDNIGALLDNVSVSAVPEPATLSLLLAGIAALGFAARRRRA
jgi:hypothetical protein